MSGTHHNTREPNISVGNWGCKADNITALHLLDIFKGEKPFVINKINRLLSKNYQKMVNLVGIGKYQHYYLLLVRKDVIKELEKIDIQNKSTFTHAASIIMMLHREFSDLAYDENDPLPKC